MRAESGRKKFADYGKFTIDDVRQIIEERKKIGVSQESEEKVRNTLKKDGPLKVTPPLVVQEAPMTTIKNHMEKRKSASVLDILGFNPLEVRGSVCYDRDSVRDEWKCYFDQLIAMRDELERRVSLLTKETLRQGDIGDADVPNMLGQHMADGAAQQIDLDLAYSYVDNERELLKEVNAALERIENGTYGICQQTGERIDDERLAAQPYARFSIKGQQEYERDRSARKNTTPTTLFLSEDGERLFPEDPDGDLHENEG
jgi:RNA polymerase-binding transcription factor DksA